MNDELNLRSIIDGKECDVKLTIEDNKGNKREITGLVNEKSDSEQPEDIKADETSNDNPRIIKINPVKFMNSYKDDERPSPILEKIAFDKDLKADCVVTYEFNCDGTFALVETGIQNGITEAMSKALYLIIQKFLDKDLVIKRFSIEKVKYIFGEATLIRNYGVADEHDTVSIPIKCEYVE